MSRIKYFLQQVKEFAISFVLFSGCAVFPRSQSIMVKYLEFVSCFHCCVIVPIGQVTRAIHRHNELPLYLSLLSLLYETYFYKPCLLREFVLICLEQFLAGYSRRTSAIPTDVGASKEEEE